MYVVTSNQKVDVLNSQKMSLRKEFDQKVHRILIETKVTGTNCIDESEGVGRELGRMLEIRSAKA
jgi:hypothetical protein